ncbi:hypothetical protein EYF80_022656 [Liparis tanakae]|uniref:Uncharacterized protein n=1 Tax=Liparis tanakae TaxID=230148 RepID=A0A4Z2HMQ2_9TELE|nr:hypothetical protein EYF80_022656 [Liparis tanakae]
MVEEEEEEEEEECFCLHASVAGSGAAHGTIKDVRTDFNGRCWSQLPLRSYTQGHRQELLQLLREEEEDK